MEQRVLQRVITDPDSAETLVEEANGLGKSLKNSGLTTSQIRALFGEVRQIQAQWSMGGAAAQQARRRLLLLKPKMAYRARRESGRAVEELVGVLDPAIDYVVRARDLEAQEANFGRFVEFFEAILAYHKAHGGR